MRKPSYLPPYLPPYLEPAVQSYVEYMQGRLDEAEAEVANAVKAQTSGGDLRAQLDNALSTIQYQKTQLAAAERQYQSLLAGDANVAGALAEASQRLAIEQDRVAELKAQLDAANATIASNKADYAKDLRAEQQRIAELIGELNGWKANNAELQKGLDEAWATIGSEDSKTKIENAELKKENRQLKERDIYLVRQDMELQKEVSKLRAELKDARETIREDSTKAVSAAERYRVGIIGAVLLAILFIVIFVILKA